MLTDARDQPSPSPSHPLTSRRSDQMRWDQLKRWRLSRSFGAVAGISRGITLQLFPVMLLRALQLAYSLSMWWALWLMLTHSMIHSLTNTLSLTQSYYHTHSLSFSRTHSSTHSHTHSINHPPERITLAVEMLIVSAPSPPVPTMSSNFPETQRRIMIHVIVFQTNYTGRYYEYMHLTSQQERIEHLE